MLLCMYFLLFYDYVADMADRRTPFRPQHLQLVQAAQAAGELEMAGALDEPLDGAVLVFSCSSPEPIERFIAADPYVQNGLVTRTSIRRWNVVTTPPQATT